MIQNIFPIPIFFCDLNLNNTSIAFYCYKLKEKSRGRYFTNEGGWQSENLNLKDFELQPLIKSFEDPIVTFAKNCGFKKNLIYKLDSMWININGYKDYNNPHNHPGCLFSGVYYVKTPENCGNLMFSNPSIQTVFDWKDELMENFNTINSSSWYLPAQENKLYLFPSWAYHYVKPNLNKNEDRISLAFNITNEF